jgi:hypothetical protein
MSFTVACPGCGIRLTIRRPERFASRSVRCPGCRTPIPVGRAEPPPLTDALAVAHPDSPVLPPVASPALAAPLQDADLPRGFHVTPGRAVAYLAAAARRVRPARSAWRCAVAG